MLTYSFFRKARTAHKINNAFVKVWVEKGRIREASSLSYCLDLVKNLDHENYLCSLLLPDNLKATAFAIRAFNIEISRIQEQVTEKNIMPVRFHFWENLLDDLYSNKTAKHPVIEELSKAIKRHKLSKLFLKRLITVRSTQLERSTFKDLSEMALYADQTNSPIYMLLLEASGVKDINCDHAAAHLGIAQGLTNLIRGLPHNASEHLAMMPMTVMAKYNVSEESLFRMTADLDAVSNVVYEVAVVASQNLGTARSLQDKIPPKHRSIFLPAVSVGAYLDKLRKANFNTFEKTLTIRNVTLPVYLYWYKYRQKF